MAIDATLTGRDVRRLLGARLGTPVSVAQRLYGGRNSRVYRVKTEAGKIYAAKFYFADPNRPNRCRREFETLSLLWKNGFRREIPRPVLAVRKERFAVYGLAPGIRPAPGQLGAAAIGQMTRFLARLNRLSGTAAARNFPPASAACLAPAHVLEILAERFDRFRDRRAIRREFPDLDRFLYGEFATARRAFESRFSASPGWERRLAEDELTLSPSDFGRHNTLLKDDGHLIFLDFEYFGRDDPAKLIVDFLLHPGNLLRRETRADFFRRSLTIYRDRGQVPERVDAIYALHGLVWCLIMLNEFTPREMARRAFAGVSERRIEAQRARQFRKARRLLAHLLRHGGRLPFTRSAGR